MKVKTRHLKAVELNYLVAKLEGHESRAPWMLEQSGYAMWQSYERAWGNPIPDYTSWSEGGPLFERLMEEHGIAVWKASPESSDKFEAEYAFSISMDGRCSGPTPLIAVLRCYLLRVMGEDVELPSGILAEG